MYEVLSLTELPEELVDYLDDNDIWFRDKFAVKVDVGYCFIPKNSEQWAEVYIGSAEPTDNASLFLRKNIETDPDTVCFGFTSYGGTPFGPYDYAVNVYTLGELQHLLSVRNVAYFDYNTLADILRIVLTQTPREFDYLDDVLDYMESNAWYPFARSWSGFTQDLKQAKGVIKWLN